MMRRVAVARNGLTYFDVNRHCLVEVSGEVLEIKRQIEERWPGVLDVHFDKERLKYVVSQRDRKGNWSLLFETDRLNHGTIERIHRAETQSATELLAEIDSHNEALEADQDRKFEDQIGDFGERFAFALKQDGVRDHEDIFGIPNRRPRRLVNQ